MAQANINLGGVGGWGGLVVLVVVVLWRLATLGPTFDPALNDAIRAELRNEVGNEMGKALAESNPRSAADVARLIAMNDESAVQVHSTRVSKPLLSFGGTQRAVVRVAYTLPDGIQRDEFWAFDTSLIGGWRYKHRSSATSYYLNFL